MFNTGKGWETGKCCQDAELCGFQPVVHPVQSPSNPTPASLPHCSPA